MFSRFQCILAVCLATSFLSLVHAENKDEKATRLKASYDKKIEKSEVLEGLLTFRRKDNKVYLDLKPEDLDRKFLIFPSIARGIAEGGFFGGRMMGGDDWVFSFHRVGDRIQIVRKNIRFRADKGSPLEKTVELSFSDSIQASLKILGIDSESDRILIRMDKFLTSDLISLGEDFSATFKSSFRLDADRTYVSKLQVFEKNFEVEVEQTFSGGDRFLLDTVPDGRSMGITMHYSVLELPEDEDFQPRPADDRVGHFLTALKDYSSKDPDAGPWIRYVNRWKLEKSNPKAKASPVKQPIVFYISRTVPYEFRPYVREGVMAWNKAFDAIGFLEAIEVRQQGSSDDWDSGDVRYNTIQWTSEASFAGLGPSRGHPLTGQLLDADILYNGSVVAGMRRRYPVFGPKPTGTPEKDSQDLETLAPPHPDTCSFQNGFQHEVELAALHALAAEAPSTSASKTSTEPVEISIEFLGAAVRKTIIHEVGHVLGLRHNFKGSSEVPKDKLHDVKYTRKHGLTASIMDYPAANLAPPGETQGEYFSSTVGPYDLWAIRYAYSDLNQEFKALKKAKKKAGEDISDLEELDEEGQHKAALKYIASLGAQPGHAFASDEDRWTGGFRNLDPKANVYELGDDTLAYASERYEVIKGLWDGLLTRVIAKGESYHKARYAVRVLLGHLMTVSATVSPHIGGQFHYRDHRGDPLNRPSFQPVSAQRQRQALKLLCDTIFRDEQFQLSPELLNSLAPNHHSHWGVGGLGTRLDFPIHDYILKVQKPTLQRLLSPEILSRLTDGLRQSKTSTEVFTAEELLKTLVDRCFEELAKGSKAGTYSTREPFLSSMRRNLQRQVVARLSSLALDLPGQTASDASLLARHALKDLHTRLKGFDASGIDTYSESHLSDLSARIETTLKAERFRQTP